MLELPVDYPRTTTRSTRSVISPLRFAPEENAALTAVCRREATTRAVVMLAALGTVVAAACKQRDVVIACPSNTRLAHGELEGMLGRFTGPLLYRLHVDDDLRMTLAQAKEAARAAQADAGLPSSVVLDFDSPLDHPLVRVVLDPPAVVEKSGDPPLCAGARIEPGAIIELPARVELTVYISDEDEADGALAGAVFAAADFFAPESVKRIARELHDAVIALTRL